MRILMLVHNTAWGSGTFFRALGMASALARRGHQVSLMASGRDRRLTPSISVHSGVEVVQPAGLLPFRIRHGGLSPIDLVSRMNWLRDRRFDLVHGFEHRPSVLMPALTVRRRQAVPYVHDWADIWGWPGIASQRSLLGKATLGLPDAFFERRLPRWADAVTVVNSYLGERLVAEGRDPDRVVVIPPGSGPVLADEVELWQARQEWGLPVDARILAYVGISRYDDPFTLAVWQGLRERLADAVLVIAGDPSPRSIRELEQDIVSERVRFLGLLEQNRVHSLLSSADLLVLPFTDRGINLGRFPNRIGDYLASGRPIVTNATGDLGRLVREREVGLALGEDPDEFALQTAALLGDPERRERFGSRARQLAETEMNWDHHAVRVEQLYRRVLARGRRLTA